MALFIDKRLMFLKRTQWILTIVLGFMPDITENPFTVLRYSYNVDDLELFYVIIRGHLCPHDHSANLEEQQICVPHDIKGKERHFYIKLGSIKQIIADNVLPGASTSLY